MILSTCASLMQDERNKGNSEETAIMAAHAFVTAQSLPEHEIKYAMGEVRTIAAKIYDTAQAA